MLLSAVSVLVVAQSSSEVPEGFLNNPVFIVFDGFLVSYNVVCYTATDFPEKRRDFWCEN